MDWGGERQSLTFFSFKTCYQGMPKLLVHRIQFEQQYLLIKSSNLDFPGGPVVKNLPTNAGDKGLIPGLGRFHMPQGS